MLVTLLLVDEGLTLIVTNQKQLAVDKVTQTISIKRESERLLTAALEEKVALRGFLITQDPALIEQYQEEY